MTGLPRPAHAPDVVPLLLSLFVGAVDLSKGSDSGVRPSDKSMRSLPGDFKSSEASSHLKALNCDGRPLFILHLSVR